MAQEPFNCVMQMLQAPGGGGQSESVAQERPLREEAEFPEEDCDEPDEREEADTDAAEEEPPHSRGLQGYCC
jgi:hypothetical protein